MRPLRGLCPELDVNGSGALIRHAATTKRFMAADALCDEIRLSTMAAQDRDGERTRSLLLGLRPSSVVCRTAKSDPLISMIVLP